MMKQYDVDTKVILICPAQWNQYGEDNAKHSFFHVHGFIPGQHHLDAEIENMYPVSSGHIVLSKDSYYIMEREETYQWWSSIQADYLNRYHCLFVDFSTEDHTFCRILRQIGSKRPVQKELFLFLTVDIIIKSIQNAVINYEKKVNF